MGGCGRVVFSVSALLAPETPPVLDAPPPGNDIFPFQALGRIGDVGARPLGEGE